MSKEKEIEKLQEIWYNVLTKNQEFDVLNMKKYLADIITGLRIIGSIVLLFFPALSVAFYIYITESLHLTTVATFRKYENAFILLQLVMILLIVFINILSRLR